MRNSTETTYTFRLPATLKAQAEEAADALDVTIAQVLRKALRQLVQHAKRHPDWEHQTPLPTGLIAAGQAVSALVTKTPEISPMQTLETEARRLLQLEKMEKTNTLNKVTRRELADLREKVRRAACA